MEIKIIEDTFRSSDGMHNVYFRVHEPEEPRAIFQIAHGMCEYIRRYDDFARFMAENGFVVCGNDHLGHGMTATDPMQRGWFAEEKGWEKVVSDMHRLTKLMRARYPGLPVILFGHSMGSFLARAYLTRWGKSLAASVICGTASGMPATEVLLTVIEGMKAVRGDTYRSKTVNSMAFGAYNSQITDPRTPYDWISRDNEIVDKYNADPLCNYVFTLNGFENLTKVLWYVSQDKWFDTYPKELPTYLIAGSADPVGNYGKGVLEVYNKLRVRGCGVEMKIYSGARHELLNEINREEVYRDVLDFVTSVLDGAEDPDTVPEEE